MPLQKSNKLAIIGYSGVFPNADNADELWQILLGQEATFSTVTNDRWDMASYYSEDRYEAAKSTSKWLSSIDLDSIKAEYFSQFPQPDQKHTDPQQLILLRETQRSLDKAGITAQALSGFRVSVSVASMAADNLLNATTKADQIGPHTTLGNYEALLANRVSQHFGFTASSKTINTACSASLVALSDARYQLMAGDCDYAIVAAANISLNPLKFISFSKAGMLSPTGQCRPFDISANGYVPADCVGALVLTTVARARVSGHPIFGIIEGLSVNHNGQRSLSATAPSVEAQVELLGNALQDADLKASDITYIEAHGTGTSLGDPIELEAMAQIYGANACAVGSIKGVIGHAEAAAGLAGIIKILLMFQNRVIPGNFWLNKVNPLVADRSAQLTIPSTSTPWLSGLKRTAALSSFGFGGSNCHLLISEYSGEASSASHPQPGFSASNVYLYEAAIPHGLESAALKNWLLRRNWSNTPPRSVFSSTGRRVIETSVDGNLRLREMSTDHFKNTVSCDSLDAECSLIQHVTRPLSVLSHKPFSAAYVDRLSGLFPSGSFVLSPDNQYWILPVSLVDELGSISSLVASSSSQWTSRFSELEVHQFTFKLLVAKWKKATAGMSGLEAFASCMAYIELCDKWKLKATAVPDSMRFAYQLAAQGFISPLIVIQMINSHQFNAYALFDSILRSAQLNPQKARLPALLKCDFLEHSTSSQTISIDAPFAPSSTPFFYNDLFSMLVDLWLAGEPVNWQGLSKECSSNHIFFSEKAEC
ncbi:Polyketide synthetase domain protein [Pseudomonas coronafaciens pv. atropurpurea]|uniref:beta-ketoacyl [acyl carrier protein] synthase domain-containing protein n=1 Tax=Pseudomonas coronafaciens TaxID=53409 RepID=UPI0006D5D51D|nr:polyketide synthase [Pseudomonas coronafaciens]KPW37162.1 Polyketide synthetase domain protein [Pseudomonas coronafaciens pv. atropurpurea]RMT62321.1 Polyketide synthetase domain protein [Pseudomonas coronafaciens pv. atropurpurea]